MSPVLDSFIAGLPVLLLHFFVTLGMLAAAVTVYVWTTPHKDFALVRQGNAAAAVSLSAAILGLAIPLAVCMATSVSVADIVIWGLLTLLIQVVAFRLTDLILRDLPRRIEAGEIGPALLLASIKLAVALINAAAISG